MTTRQKFTAYKQWFVNELQGKKTITQVYYELAADNRYDTLVSYQKRVATIKGFLTKIHTPYTHVLDLACGTGAVIDALAHTENLVVVGTDISEGMLTVARKRFARFPKITFKQGSFTTLSFPKHSFDLITMAHAMRHVPVHEEEQFIANLATWLTSDGTVLFIEHEKTYIPFVSRLFPKLVKGSNLMNFSEKEIVRMMSPLFVLESIQVNSLAFEIYQLGRLKGYFFKKRKLSD